jgi:hypothetical protein
MQVIQQREVEIETKHLEQEYEVATNNTALQQALDSMTAQLQQAELQSR